MLDFIVRVNDFVNGIVWGVPILVLIFATGLFFTIRLGFFQFTHFGFLFRDTIVKAFKKKDEEKPAKGELTSFQAAMTSVSAIVGSGNIAGVATAIVVGGPGALFWMIVAAVFGMAHSSLRSLWESNTESSTRTARSAAVQCTTWLTD